MEERFEKTKEQLVCRKDITLKVKSGVAGRPGFVESHESVDVPRDFLEIFPER
jgi:hypothetical protein